RCRNRSPRSRAPAPVPPPRPGARMGTSSAAREWGRRARSDRTRDEPPESREGPFERGDLHALVAPVGVAGGAGPEVDGVDPAHREVGDVGPRLLRLELELTGGA